MSILDILRFGVELANQQTRPWQGFVGYERSLGRNAYGEQIYAPMLQMHAIVDYAARQVRTREGVLTLTRATIDFLDIREMILATEGEGIGNEDRITLPDGDTGPILDIRGFIDAGTTHPTNTTVMLG